MLQDLRNVKCTIARKQPISSTVSVSIPSLFNFVRFYKYGALFFRFYIGYVATGYDTNCLRPNVFIKKSKEY